MARSLNELRRMQRAQLKQVNKNTLIDSILDYNGDAENELSGLGDQLKTITTELAELKQSIKSITSPNSVINRKIKDLEDQVNKQSEVIMQQQHFLEAVDRRERETKQVVLGVPEEEEVLGGAVSEEEKIRKVWNVMEEEFKICSHHRLNRKVQHGRKRPILVTVESKQVRDSVLSKTRKLKDATAPFDRIYVKKDVHPSVRKEWKRLRDAEDAEKQRPENEGRVTRLDVRERKLYCDEVVIDRWNPAPF